MVAALASELDIRGCGTPIRVLQYLVRDMNACNSMLDTLQDFRTKENCYSNKMAIETHQQRGCWICVNTIEVYAA